MRTKSLEDEFPATELTRSASSAENALSHDKSGSYDDPQWAPTINWGATWYETGMTPRERKRRGHFSTPLQLVKEIFDACGYTSQAGLMCVRVLDPACGSGNFLVEAAHRLLAWGKRVGLDQAAQATLLQHNLWGFDPDPVACFLAQMHLYQPGETFTEIHIHQADALVLPWEPCVDIVVANPPYLAAKNTDLSGYHSAQRKGQTDSYLLFLGLALQALRPGGWMGLVLPDPLLARANAAKERRQLLEEATVHHIWHLSGVFAADVGAVVIIAQKCPPKQLHQVSWVRGKWQNVLPAGHQIPQSLLHRQPGAEFRYFLNSAHGSIIERLRLQHEKPQAQQAAWPAMSRRLAPLSEFLRISRGEELGKNNPYITKFVTQVPVSDNDNHSYPVLLGGIDIRPYTVPTAKYRIAGEAVAKPLERYLSAKLLVVKSTDRLQAALDLQGHVALQTLYLLHSRTRDTSVDDLYFFLALLNSRLLCEYVYMLHTAYKWVQPQIEQSVLARLPIPLVEANERSQIIQLSRLLVDACIGGDPVVEWKQDMYCLNEEQERAICALYETVVPGLFVRA